MLQGSKVYGVGCNLRQVLAFKNLLREGDRVFSREPDHGYRADSLGGGEGYYGIVLNQAGKVLINTRLKKNSPARAGPPYSNLN